MYMSRNNKRRPKKDARFTELQPQMYGVFHGVIKTVAIYLRYADENVSLFL